MTEREPTAWRDENRLPLSELDQAMATYSQDGQVDDATGGDAGAEAYEVEVEAEAEAEAGHDGDPDPDSEEGRRLRPSPDGTTPTGRTGPS
ncbi:hypothetical protein [Luedemannella helvata]|uniref:Uncharacterized protein n=1 Tax=Luedemannella helvata TaxID=349315 RepID=A0ABP4WU66_9ACTN